MIAKIGRNTKSPARPDVAAALREIAGEIDCVREALAADGDNVEIKNLAADVVQLCGMVSAICSMLADNMAGRSRV